MSAPPCICTGPESCGLAGVWPAGAEQECVVCGTPGACFVARCGATRCGHVHTAGDFLTEHSRRVAAGSAARGVTRSAELHTVATAPAVAVVETPAAAPEGEDKPLRLLAALETTHAPTRKIGNILKPPTWCPALPGITGVVRVVSGFAWKRPGVRGKPIVLDRNAAFLSAAASVRVAHGPLEHTGPLAGYDRERAGYFQIEAHPWHWGKRLPNPLGTVKSGGLVWVPAPTVQLLTALAEQGRWGDVAILDSYTAPGVDLRRWTTWVRDLRTRIIEDHGTGSAQYADFKVAYSQAITLMIGAEDPGRGRKWKCRAHRPDWAHAVHAQASANLWRGADACLAADVGPVAMVNVDEIHLPEEAMPLLLDERTSPVRMDRTGIKLGTYKIKPAGR